MFIDHADAMRRKLALGFSEEYIFRQIDSSEGRQLKEITEVDITVSFIKDMHLVLAFI